MNKEIENKLNAIASNDATELLPKEADKLLSYIEQLEEAYDKEKYLVDKLTRQLTDEYKNTEKQKERGDHYKHLYSEVKKQKDDVVEYIKSLHIFSARSNGKTLFAKILNEILRMLGEIDD